MPRADLQWIELTDFSPGIWSNNNLAGGLNVTSTNLAYASPANTFRCRSLPTGGLGPLPRRKEDFALTDPPGADATTTFRVCGLDTFGGIFADPLTDTDSDHRAEIHLALDYYEIPNDDRFLVWVRETIYNDTPATETILTRTFNNTGSSGTPRFAYFNTTRLRTSSPDQPGWPVTTLHWANNPIGGSDDNRISRAFPDPDAPTTNATEVIGVETEAYTIAVTHQGRVVLGKFLSFDRGVDTGIFTNENFVWTNVNLPTLSTSTPAVFVPELDQSISDLASMSANALFAVKQLGGGYVMQGDLDDVTVVQLPNIMCPDGGDYVRGANTPIGYIYSAGDAGLYVWNGGDSAKPVSAQLDGQCFTGGITIDGANGQCDRWQDLFLAPRNWVMDLNTQGWWQLDDPDDIELRFWSTSRYHSQTYGAPSSFAPTGTAFSLYEMDDLAYTYIWQSHPIWISRDKRMEVRQGVIALQGHGQVTVTVFDPTDDSRTSVEIIDVDDDFIRNYRFDVSLDAENLCIRLESSGDNGSGPGSYEAPLIHRAFFGWAEAQHLGNANN